jgi:hypothetical protein
VVAMHPYQRIVVAVPTAALVVFASVNVIAVAGISLVVAGISVVVVTGISSDIVVTIVIYRVQVIPV